MTPTSEHRPRGPKPKISRAAIAQAVVAIGFDEVTMKGVAEHLGVSVAGLYHHSRGREDLLRIGAEELLSAGQLPPYEGRSWREWLHEVAWYLRMHLARHPEMVTRYLHGLGAFRDSAMHLEAALEALGSLGFAPIDAYAAFQTVGEFALGAAVDDLREQTFVREQRPRLAQIHGALAMEPAGFRRLRDLLPSFPVDDAEFFERRLALILDGIGASRERLVEPRSAARRAFSRRPKS